MKIVEMKKRVLMIAGTVSAMALIYFAGSGFLRNTSAFIQDYSISADGKEITVKVGVSSSIGYIRDVKVRRQQGGELYLDCYSAFGGFNGSIGAKDTFTFQLKDDTAMISVYRGSNVYGKVLVKAEDGSWQRILPR